jgi:hypothetical protein
LLQIGGILRFWMLCGLMALAGLASAPGVTARGVLLPALAERAGMPLVRAASLYDGAARCASMVGAALGGVLITAMGASHVLLVDAATFGVSAVVISSSVRGSGGRHQGSFGESLGFLLRAPLLLGICLTTLAAQGLDQGWSSVLLPDDVRVKFGSVLDVGMLETVFAVCALAGALLYGAVAHRWGRRAVFAVAFLIVGVPRFAVAALTGSVAPLAVMMAVEGLACGTLNPIRATVVYETVPEHLRSQVISTMTSTGLMAAPFGGLVAGFSSVPPACSQRRSQLGACALPSRCGRWSPRRGGRWIRDEPCGEVAGWREGGGVGGGRLRLRGALPHDSVERGGVRTRHVARSPRSADVDDGDQRRCWPCRVPCGTWPPAIAQ